MICFFARSDNAGGRPAHIAGDSMVILDRACLHEFGVNSLLALS